MSKEQQTRAWQRLFGDSPEQIDLATKLLGAAVDYLERTIADAMPEKIDAEYPEDRAAARDLSGR